MRDDTAKRIIATAQGKFHAAETLQMLIGLRESGGLTYGLVFDVRRISGTPTVGGLKSFRDALDTVVGFAPPGFFSATDREEPGTSPASASDGFSPWS